jgi:hypothetical protein
VNKNLVDPRLRLLYSFDEKNYWTRMILQIFVFIISTSIKEILDHMARKWG